MFADPAEAFVVFERPTREQIQVLSRTFVAWQPQRHPHTSVTMTFPGVFRFTSRLKEFTVAKDAVSTVMYWIIWDLVDCIKDLDVPPPIQSRRWEGPKWIRSVDLCRL